MLFVLSCEQSCLGLRLHGIHVFISRASSWHSYKLEGAYACEQRQVWGSGERGVQKS